MTNEEIRQKAIECGKAYEMMCKSKECETDEEFNTICRCEYNEVGKDVPCSAVYGYEHGFADGVEEGKKLSTAWIPVTERLPETEKWATWFLTTTAVGFVIPMQWENTTVRGKAVSRWVWEGRISPWKVIAWMPLPEPFKEGEEGGENG